MGKSPHRIFSGACLRLSLLVCLVLAATVPSTAQTFYGSILGTVSDSGGAVIPGAATTLTNEGTQERHTSQTDGAGNYQYVNLIPGSYRLDVEKAGFKHLTRPGIVVEVQTGVRIDVTLDVGQLVQTVEVKAQTPLLQTDTAALGQVISHPQEMPLNGRNVLTLAALVPGVITQGAAAQNPTGINNTGWGNYQISGGLANENAGYFDGAPINVNYIDMIALVPSQDAVQEFRVQTNDLSAEFGRFSGGVINLTTKSGSNTFHGAAYEYLRNTKLNANTFFANRGGLKVPAYNQNQFGATFGGPIQKDKSFFFFGYEGYRQRAGTTLTTTVPSAAMEQGDFTAAGLPTLYDPLTTCGAPANPGGPTPPACGSGVTLYNRQSFTSEYGSNIIPNGTNVAGVASQLNPASVLLAKAIYPLPNTNGSSLTNNFVNNYSPGGDNDQINARIDRTVSDRQHVFGRFTYWTIKNITISPLGNVADPYNSNTNDLSEQIVLADTFSFNPTTVGDIHVSWMRYDYYIDQVTDGADVTKWGFPAYMNSIPHHDSPQPCISGFGGYPCNSGIIISHNQNWSAAGSLTKIKGKHTLKFGFEIRKMTDSYMQSNTEGGYFTFDNGFTALNPNKPAGSGYSFASYMLGYPSSGSAGEPSLVGGREWYNAFYAQDTLQLTNRLTLNLGVRYDVPIGWGEKYNRILVMQPNNTNFLAQATGLPLKGDAAIVGSTLFPGTHEFDNRWNLFAPRLGLAYRAPHGFVVRTGFGIFHLPADAIFGSNPYSFGINNYTNTMLNSLNGNLTPYLPMSNPFPSGIVYPIGNNPGAAQQFLAGTSITAPIPSNSYGYMQQWNFNVEKELTPGTMIEVAYAGSKGVHVPRSSHPFDVLPDADLSMGTALQATMPNPFYGLITVGSLSPAKVTEAQLLRPYPQYTGFSNLGAADGDTNYQAMLIKFQKRFPSAGSILVSYTWSKLMTNVETATSWLESNVGNTTGGVQNWHNLGAEWSPSSNDVPHNLVASYTLGLPIGNGKKFLGTASGAANKVVSGWGVNGIYTLQSGVPLVITDSVNNSNATGNGTQRPNLVSGCSIAYNTPAASRYTRWFNTSCFTQPAAFTFGNGPRELTNVRAAGINNADFSLFKDTKLSERFSLQFRAEFFNLWNRVQFSAPGQAFGASNFGIISSQKNFPRLAQLALRLEF